MQTSKHTDNTSTIITTTLHHKDNPTNLTKPFREKKNTHTHTHNKLHLQSSTSNPSRHHCTTPPQTLHNCNVQHKPLPPPQPTNTTYTTPSGDISDKINTSHNRDDKINQRGTATTNTTSDTTYCGNGLLHADSAPDTLTIKTRDHVRHSRSSLKR